MADTVLSTGWPTHIAKSGWRPDTIERSAITHRITEAEKAVLFELVDHNRARGLNTTGLTRDDFSHTAIDGMLAHMLDMLKTGPGIVFLSGLPYDEKPLDDIRMMYWGIGTHFGTGVSQNSQGELMGEVRVRADVVSRRAYGHAGSLILHSDRIDILSLFCVSKPRSGGANLFVSSLAIWDAIERERPDVLAILQRGFHQNRLGEHLVAGEESTCYRVPIFGSHEKLRSVLFSGNANLDHQKTFFADILTAEEEEALIFLAAVRDRPELAFPAMLELGEAVFLNNHEVLHSREAFEDGESVTEKRLLLRLWLQGDPCRPKPDAMTVMRNPSGRQGIDLRPTENHGTVRIPEQAAE